MGYEAKLIIVQKWSNPLSLHVREGVHMGMEIARLDLPKPGSDSNICKMAMDRQKRCREQWGFWGDDGNTVIKRDCYNTPLVGIPIEDFLRELERDCAKDEYRRFHIALDMLQSIKKRFERQSIVVLWYGH